MSNWFIYDLETLRNCFLFSGKFRGDPTIYTFEISDRRNDRDDLLAHLSWHQNSGTKMVGFNNLGFDYPILHNLLNNPYTFNALTAYTLCQEIITKQEYGFTAIQFKDRIIPQVDLAKINHFDNRTRRTSLKSLQFAMRSESVEDLPFEVGTTLTSDQMDKLIKYNIHDITETEKFFEWNFDLIKMRQELLDNGVLTGDVLNFSDKKIGTEYLIKKIGRSKCFHGYGKPMQTQRQSVSFKDIILPKIAFRTEKFEAVLDWFKAQTIWIGGEESPKLKVELADIPFVFGVGGVHASVENQVFESTETHVIKDIDVSGMYVAVAVANGFAPEHLGKDFVTAYKQLQRDRAQYPKGTAMNGTLKLAGNGVYGDSNNEYSCFHDPQYTYSVTVNGQLQLLQLVESLSLIPGIKIIQANTDGITALVPRALEQFFQLWKSEWECDTSLKLEEFDYKKMWIRDVNSYLGLLPNGKIKAKGAYWYPKSKEDYNPLTWPKDFSNLCVKKTVERVLVHGDGIEDALYCNTNEFDFMARYKTTAGAKVYIGEQEMLKTVRYFIATDGEKMIKVSTPKGIIGDWKRKHSLTDSEYKAIRETLPEGTWDERIHTKNKSKVVEARTGIEAAHLVRECNVATKFNWDSVDYSYYVEEVKKLLIGAVK